MTAKLQLQLCLAVLLFLSTVQGGPYVSRGEKPVAKALVATAQLYVQQTYLAVVSRVLFMSRDVSSIADKTTELAYVETEAAETRLAETAQRLVERADELSARTLKARNCVRRERITKSVRDVVQAAARKLYNCTHAVANRGAGFEVRMAQTITSGRTTALEVMAAMWFCQNDLPEPDEECVRRLTENGLTMVNALPDKARIVLEDAQSFGEQAKNEIRKCVFVHVSNATAAAVALSETLKKCVPSQ